MLYASSNVRKTCPPEGEKMKSTFLGRRISGAMKSMFGLMFAVTCLSSTAWAQTATNPANYYQCVGVGVTLVYSASSSSGHPWINVARFLTEEIYRSGNQVRIQPTVFGSLVSIMEEGPDRIDTLTLIVPTISQTPTPVTFVTQLFTTRTKPREAASVNPQSSAQLISCVPSTVVY